MAKPDINTLNLFFNPLEKLSPADLILFKDESFVWQKKHDSLNL